MTNRAADEIAILTYLVRRKRTDGASSAQEVSRGTNHNSTWAARKLSRLAEGGFVERLGETFSGARCWGITDAGRARLDGTEPSPK